MSNYARSLPVCFFVLFLEHFPPYPPSTGVYDHNSNAYPCLIFLFVYLALFNNLIVSFTFFIFSMLDAFDFVPVGVSMRAHTLETYSVIGTSASESYSLLTWWNFFEIPLREGTSARPQCIFRTLVFFKTWTWRVLSVFTTCPSDLLLMIRNTSYI